jgi:hypothetical protein
MHNIIIKSERELPVVDNQSSDHECHFAKVYRVSSEFASFFTVHQEIRDGQVHTKLQNDLEEHLWALKKIATWFYTNFCIYNFSFVFGLLCETIYVFKLCNMI